MMTSNKLWVSVLLSLSERQSCGKDESRRINVGPQMRAVLRVMAVVIVFGLGAAAARAEEAKPPYFASLKNATTNMREGPSDNNRIKWVYHRKGLPVEVIASYEVWRRVRDMDGEVGWIHNALLSRERTVVVHGKSDAPVRGGADLKTAVVAQAKPGAIGRVRHCGVFVCQVRFDGAEGWMDRNRLWGINDGEQF
jgi:SH3-like domain-containing protein